MSVLERSPFYRESNKSKERKGPTLGVRFKEGSVKREFTVQSPSSKTDTFWTGTVLFKRDVHFIESTKRSKERQGPTLGVRLTEVSVKREIERFYCNHYYSGTVSSLAIAAVEAINM